LFYSGNEAAIGVENVWCLYAILSLAQKKQSSRKYQGVLIALMISSWQPKMLKIEIPNSGDSKIREDSLANY